MKLFFDIRLHGTDWCLALNSWRARGDMPGVTVSRFGTVRVRLFLGGRISWQRTTRTPEQQRAFDEMLAEPEIAVDPQELP